MSVSDTPLQDGLVGCGCLMDVIHLRGRRILHIVDVATGFQISIQVNGETVSEMFQALRQGWLAWAELMQELMVDTAKGVHRTMGECRESHTNDSAVQRGTKCIRYKDTIQFSRWWQRSVGCLRCSSQKLRAPGHVLGV